MAYMHVCPKCRSFFKVRTKGKATGCPKCSYQYLLDLKMDDEAWGTLTCDEKKIIIKARMSEEGLLGVAVTGSAPAEDGSSASPAANDKQVKKVVKKVVRKKVIKRVVKKVVKEPEAALNEKEPVTEQKTGLQEETYKEEVNKEEETGQHREDESEAGEKKEEKQAVPKKEKVKLNKKYVAIVAGSMGALLLYLLTITFIIPGFRMRSELPVLRSAAAGDIVQFGKYRGQDEWVVLDKKGTKLLCISDYPIYGQTYYDEEWDDSVLRKWFNSVFINSSFNVYERLRIKSTKDIQKEYPDYTRDVGADAADKVFLISDRELNDYLHPYKDAMIRVNDDDIRAVCWIETK